MNNNFSEGLKFSSEKISDYVFLREKYNQALASLNQMDISLCSKHRLGKINEIINTFDYLEESDVIIGSLEVDILYKIFRQRILDIEYQLDPVS